MARQVQNRNHRRRKGLVIMITITNITNKPTKSIGISFKPGESPYRDNEFNSSQLAQLNANPDLTVNQQPDQKSKKKA